MYPSRVPRSALWALAMLDVLLAELTLIIFLMVIR